MNITGRFAGIVGFGTPRVFVFNRIEAYSDVIISSTVAGQVNMQRFLDVYLNGNWVGTMYYPAGTALGCTVSRSTSVAVSADIWNSMLAIVTLIVVPNKNIAPNCADASWKYYIDLRVEASSSACPPSPPSIPTPVSVGFVPVAAFPSAVPSNPPPSIPTPVSVGFVPVAAFPSAVPSNPPPVKFPCFVKYTSGVLDGVSGAPLVLRSFTIPKPVTATGDVTIRVEVLRGDVDMPNKNINVLINSVAVAKLFDSSYRECSPTWVIDSFTISRSLWNSVHLRLDLEVTLWPTSNVSISRCNMSKVVITVEYQRCTMAPASPIPPGPIPAGVPRGSIPSTPPTAASPFPASPFPASPFTVAAPTTLSSEWLKIQTDFTL